MVNITTLNEEGKEVPLAFIGFSKKSNGWYWEIQEMTGTTRGEIDVLCDYPLYILKSVLQDY